jgi:ATP-binding cassette subfamily C protein CydC
MAWAVLGVLLCCGVVLPLAVFALSRLVGRAVVEVRAELNAHLVDSMQGSRDIVGNGAGSRYLAGTAALGRRAAAAETRLALVSAGREGATELLTSLAMLMALALAIPLVTRHAIAPLYVAVPALLTLAAFEAVRPVGLAAEAMGSIRMAGQRVLTLGDAAEPVPEPAESLPLQPPYSIAFEDVTLTYPGALRPALQNVHLEVPAGSRVAVVGASGAGKTTLARLLTRALDPGTGRVLIGGTDVRRCSLRELRRTVGVVAQDTHIFDDTVRNNLLAARPGASTEELEAALEAVGLLDVARARAGGLDMWVGEHGERLSGGERQRLAVARLLLQDTPIVLLDEVTANLDPVTESALLTMLFRATRGRTVLTITHRLVGMERMDEIVVLDRGRVVERGTHATLCRAGSVYKRMLDVQENMLAV